MRIDLSQQLVHLTRGDPIEEAEKAFRSIITERRLRGSSKNIRGGHLVVCFSEAPVDVLARMFSSTGYSSRYRPFGIMVRKDWLFARGGRPVIYQPEDDYKLLPVPLQFRHVRFDKPGGEKDFTFEREWRICTEYLELEPAKCTLIVPDRELDYTLREEQLEHDKGYARALRKSPLTRVTNFDWHVLALGDLGAQFPMNDTD